MAAIGPILLIISIPLILRWVPPNRFYGFRVPPVRRSAAIWYDVNALWGRHIFLLGLIMVSAEFVVPLGVRSGVLSLLGAVGLLTTAVLDWRTAVHWERMRERVGEGPAAT
jgi:SdpI/YfhL protein family